MCSICKKILKNQPFPGYFLRKSKQSTYQMRQFCLSIFRRIL